MGEAEAVDADGLKGADLDAAVAAVTGAVQHRDAVPGQALAARQQGGLVGLDTKQVVGVLLADQELGGRRVVWSASAVTTVSARSSGASSGAKAGTSSGAPPTWRWVSTARVAWSRQASRCAGRPSAPAPRAPRRVLPSTATARCRLAAVWDGPGLGRPATRRPRRPGRRRPGAPGCGGWWPRQERRSGQGRRGGRPARPAPAGAHRRPIHRSQPGTWHQPAPRRRPAPGWRPRGGGGHGSLAGRDRGEVGEQVGGVGVLQLERVGGGEVGQGGWHRG
jgi:translation initiation factor IF-2